MTTQHSGLIREIPLAALLQTDARDRLRHDIERMAREFGYHQMTMTAQQYGQAMVTVRFEVRQSWEPAP